MVNESTEPYPRQTKKLIGTFKNRQSNNFSTKASPISKVIFSLSSIVVSYKKHSKTSVQILVLSFYLISPLLLPKREKVCTDTPYIKSGNKLTFDSTNQNIKCRGKHNRN